MEFSMTGGTLTHTGGRSGAIQAYQGATLNIGGEASISSTYYAVRAQENTVLNVDGGTVSSKESVATSRQESRAKSPFPAAKSPQRPDPLLQSKTEDILYRHHQGR